jgi:DNA invertase Pin-like site-specific DNA recombinase
MARIGYCRVSTDSQTHDLQVDALRSAGCERVFSDAASGSRTDRPGLASALEFVRAGDVLCVWRLDRLARSLKHLLEVVEILESRGVGLCSLTESIDTSSPGGRLILQVFGAISQFERDLIRDRVQSGLAAARRRGRVGGRPRAVDASRARTIRALRANGATIAEIVESSGVSRASVVRFLRQESSSQLPQEEA